MPQSMEDIELYSSITFQKQLAMPHTLSINTVPTALGLQASASNPKTSSVVTHHPSLIPIAQAPQCCWAHTVASTRMVLAPKRPWFVSLTP